jgi:hypothetical protein
MHEASKRGGVGYGRERARISPFESISCISRKPIMNCELLLPSEMVEVGEVVFTSTIIGMAAQKVS